ncbi:MAG: hypothetical protein JJT78_05880 [Leptospira sp.]|nr:hypothetical protein [Leptospira sp.]
MINQELDSSIGSHLIIQRLTDILLYYSIRHWLESNEYPTSGWSSVIYGRENFVAIDKGGEGN